MEKAIVDREKIASFCKKWEISELALFGSALREDFREDSDIDVLVSFAKGTEYSLFDMVHMQNELKEIFGRPVDVVSRRGLESSKNALRRNAILSSLEKVYAA